MQMQSPPDLSTMVPYPIVLAHGLDGFKNIGPLTYYYGVSDMLKREGHDVYTSVVDPYNSSEVRGAQLKTFVDGVLAHAACCGPNTWVAQRGSTTVFIDGKASLRLGDLVRQCGGTGALVEASSNVVVDEASGASGGPTGQRASRRGRRPMASPKQ